MQTVWMKLVFKIKNYVKLAMWEIHSKIVINIVEVIVQYNNQHF